MDFVGTAMGMATIPMALLSIASLLGGIALLAGGDGALVAAGLVGIAGGIPLVALLERVSVQLDGFAWRVLTARGRARARPAAALAGALPVAVMLGWEVAWFAFFRTADRPRLAIWLWSYGVALWPWTLYALAIHGDRRTLCGIRAYAGHLAYWLLSATVLLAGAPLPLGVVTMAAPAALPVIVGLLLAIADRDALRNVRV